MRLVLVGPPGAGKGTQAEFIAAHLSVPKISTGDIFRANVSPGHAARASRRSGTWTRASWFRTRSPSTWSGTGWPSPTPRGFLLDGFPRTDPQAAALDKLLADLGAALDLVLELVVDDDEVIRRLSGRRTCRGCGKIWHVEFDAADPDGICDRCGAELFQRDDDKPETIATRLREYAREDRAAGRLLRRAGQAGRDRRHRSGGGRHRPGHRRAAVVRRLSSGRATADRVRTAGYAHVPRCRRQRKVTAPCVVPSWTSS